MWTLLELLVSTAVGNRPQEIPHTLVRDPDLGYPLWILSSNFCPCKGGERDWFGIALIEGTFFNMRNKIWKKERPTYNCFLKLSSIIRMILHNTAMIKLRKLGGLGTLFPARTPAATSSHTNHSCCLHFSTTFLCSLPFRNLKDTMSVPFKAIK